MKSKIKQFLQVAAIVLIIPTQYGPVSCTQAQVMEYFRSIEPKETDAANRPAKPELTDIFVYRLRGTTN